MSVNRLETLQSPNLLCFPLQHHPSHLDPRAQDQPARDVVPLHRVGQVHHEVGAAGEQRGKPGPLQVQHVAGHDAGE